jgi:hypothetical protein
MAKNHSISNSNSGIGTILPSTESSTASCQGILKRMMATGIEPLSSINGNIEIISTISLGLRPFVLNHEIVESEKEDAYNPVANNISMPVSIIIFRYLLCK